MSPFGRSPLSLNVGDGIYELPKAKMTTKRVRLRTFLLSCNEMFISDQKKKRIRIPTKVGNSYNLSTSPASLQPSRPMMLLRGTNMNF